MKSICERRDWLPSERCATATVSAWRPSPKLAVSTPRPLTLPGRVKGRGVLIGTFGNGDDALTVAVAHLSLGSGSRKSQLDFIAELLGDHPHAVLMGDFNCDPDQPEMQGLYRNTRLQPPADCVPTFPSWRPQRAIDHVLVTPALAIATMQAMPAAHSDHLALSVELDVPEHALG